MTERERLDQVAKEHLSAYRYHHSLCVSRQARWLAEELGENAEKAEIAGILHDICKEMPLNDQLQYLRSRDILLGKLQQAAEAALHGLTASIWIPDKLGYDDPDVLSAIRYHTTARPAMSLLEQILFVADLTSSDRNGPEIDGFRALLPSRMDEAVAEILIYMISHVLQHHGPVLPEGVEAYNYYLAKAGLLGKGAPKGRTT